MLVPPVAIRARLTVCALAMAAAACAASSAAGPASPESPGLPTAAGNTGTTTSTDLAAFFITPLICADGAGPDCTRLPLGDKRLSTTAPARGTLYSCAAGNANAPGSITSRITWIDNATGTWNLLRKPFLPAGSGSSVPGTITVTELSGTRTIQANNMPVDAKLGDWPMTKYTALTSIDANPGTPVARSYTFALPMLPTPATTAGCVSMGAIGVTLNGVILYNAADARGNDAVANEIVDVYGGHPAMTDYHYHFVPERLDRVRDAQGHSGIIGYIRDGFALYGYRGTGGVELTNADLDECHGHSHGALGYHYHATMEYPYTVGCYKGIPR